MEEALKSEQNSIHGPIDWVPFFNLWRHGLL